MPDDVVVEHAPAKLNLALHVGAARTDGYHPVRTLMVELEGLHDTVTVRRSGARRVDCAGADGPTNLAWSALDALEARTGVALPLHVIIDKRIPSPAGLGGGSSDAAATLRAARRLVRAQAGGDRPAPSLTRRRAEEKVARGGADSSRCSGR